MDHNCQRLTASITIPTSLPVQEAEGSLAFLFFFLSSLALPYVLIPNVMRHKVSYSKVFISLLN